ncbi:VOC family protein [Jeotgalibacillus sp. R-1-5s-1]|uniref:VOC family protein n=1 Tax=Jeotgalibacillus sp. R-1-5s-1 TaxID=2555897 RepID=UPI00106AB758|nr:VOC family protein [Jeotgalibacillus sp. R-1-5s-1]TFE00791.1 VOC family protein [Jeotgalibacillus sp. R-1-5s-1]
MVFHDRPAVYVGEVVLRVTNLEESLAFYQNVIGFHILNQHHTEVTLTADGETPLVTLIQPEGVLPKQSGKTGLYHFAILLPTRADLASIIEHLADHHIRLGASDHLVSEALYFSDPDGNGIEVYRDREPEEWSWNRDQVHMTVDPLDFESVLQVQHKKWDGLPAGTKMGHIHLHVSSISDAEEFYTQLLGFEPVSRYGHQALFLSTEKYHHHIAVNTWNGTGIPAPGEQSAGLVHYTLVFPDSKQLLTAAEKTGAVEKENGYHVKDPAGNGIVMIAK